MKNKKYSEFSILKKNNPLFIAEMSANHNGSFSVAKKIIKCAKNNGADLIKIQTFVPENMTIKSKKKIFKIKSGLWKGKYLWDLYNKAAMPLEWGKDLFSYAKLLNIKIFSSVFDESAVDFLENLNCPLYKISSFEMNDFSLIKKISETKKPLIVSTGTNNLQEIDAAFDYIKNCGIKDIALLYCVSNYPAKITDFNLNNIKILKERYQCTVGFSDHSLDNTIAFSSIIAGAELVEKHVGFQGQRKGLDINFSLKGKQIKEFKDSIDNAYKLLGKNYFYRTKSEVKNRIYRRSIFSVKHIKKGEKFTTANIKKIRPGNGLSPVFFDKLLGKKSPFDLTSKTPLAKKIIKKLKIYK
jgi:pseudaminic acid synthase